MFMQDVIDEISAAAAAIGLDAAALLAVAEVESAGQAFVMVHGRREPLIRFEGHYFDRRLSGDALTRARALGLSSPAAGAVANPPTQEGRWALLGRAAKIDAAAAYESVSWGLGQVMGAHWRALGYDSVGSLVADARSGVEGQARLMARFIDLSGLTQALRRHDWKAFAHGYNGPAYAANAYDRKMASAYRRYAGSDEPARAPHDDANEAPQTLPLLMRGTTGPAVTELQERLAALGYPLDADGIFGQATAHAVTGFQTAHGLPADGIVGPVTAKALADASKG